MDWKLRKATWEDKTSIENLFVEMLQTIYNTEDVGEYKEETLKRF